MTKYQATVVKGSALPEVLSAIRQCVAANLDVDRPVIVFEGDEDDAEAVSSINGVAEVRSYVKEGSES